MIAETFTRTFIKCPHCGESGHSVDHILSGEFRPSFGPWYCDECGGSFSGAKNAGGEIELTLRAERKIITRDLLVLQPQEKPVYFVLEGMRFEGDNVEQSPEGKQYFYETHSCPTNWLRNIETLVHDGDADPHGLIEFVRSVDLADAVTTESGVDAEQTFPDAFPQEDRGGYLQ